MMVVTITWPVWTTASSNPDGDRNYYIAAYDQVHDQILKMADGLSIGIIKQFPEKFTGTS
jgi:hypothetical protein